MKLHRFIFSNITFYTGKVFIAALLFTLLSESSAQNPPQKATRQSALNAFTVGNFDLAYVQFSELSSLYPKDPLYKYYRGACLVRMEKDPFLSADLLKESIKESAAIRPVPPDAQYYLGRAMQLCGSFKDAIQAYEEFSGKAGKKAAKDLSVPELIKQCEAGKGALSLTAASAAGNIQKDSLMKTKEDVSKVTVNGSHDPVPVPYDKLLDEALIFQKRSDSSMKAAAGYRADLEKADAAGKSALWVKIREAEKQSSYYGSMADQKMAEAGKLAGIDQPLTHDTAIITEPVIAGIVTSEVAAAAKSDEKISDQKTDSTSVTLKEASKNPQPKVTEVFSEFTVMEKPVYKPGDKVEVNPKIPPGLIYRIQVAVFRNPVAPSYFKGISPIKGFRNEASGITTYYAGMFRKSADAGKALPRVKSLGFKDAYVIALMDKKTVSAERAALLEKEWGTKPLYTVQSGTEPMRDTVPQTLVFRVELKRSPKPLPKDQVEGMKKMAGTRGFDIIVTESKQNIYLIGTFLTYKSASEFSDLLIRNGYRDSKVVAYLGKREIPVETARQLFDEY